MHDSVRNLIEIQKEIQSKINNSIKFPKIIAVSKTHQMTNILPLINFGHLDFGENKVQEAIIKWQNIKSDFEHLKLHMLGGLQTNKVKYAVSIFDYIHSLDSLKLAEKISNEQIKQNRKVKIFIQINLGEENQKNGVSISKAVDFYNKCTDSFDLDIIGFMCLPPNDKDPSKYFSQMNDVVLKSGLKELSMGMSNDFIEAIKFRSTYLRIGSRIFGSRN